MKRAAPALTVVLVCSFTLSAAAATHYVNLTNTAPESPYITWANAATNIQDAIDVAEGGDEVVVTNGVYQTEGREVYGMSNRVAVTKRVTVRSVNGPAATSIVGSGPNGAAAVRCVYLTNGAVLAGFTLTNGATQTSGDSLTNQSGGGVWCESVSAVVSNCVLTGNSAFYGGGGAFYGTLDTCTLTGNSASEGGGAYSAALTNCALTGNSASFVGGGAIVGTLNNCALRANSAVYGGGTINSMLKNCTLTANSASQWGGGAYYGNLYNCTLTGNSASTNGGGAYYGSLNNCILYYNTAPDNGNYSSGNLNYCSTTPLPAAGTGNFTNAPMFADTNGWSNLRLQAGSPCINAGNNAYAVLDPTDLDGNPRIAWGTVDIGAYEFQGTIPATRYVNLDSPTPESPYTSWATAATNIQDAVDAASPGDTVLVTNGVYKTGGRAVHYSVPPNRVAVTKPLLVQSVNGPAVTTIEGLYLTDRISGDCCMRCVYLTNDAALVGFTVTNGASYLTSTDPSYVRSGGGIWCESPSAVVSNCVLIGNRASYAGGGAYGGTLNNCTLSTNSAPNGGGAYGSTLNNCILLGNSGGFGGGARDSTLNNCLLTGNSGGGAYNCTLNYCTLTGNSTYLCGGGANGGTLNNCTLAHNSVQNYGGGACNSTLNNCVLFANSAVSSGGGAYGGTLNNCTVVSNSLPFGGGFGSGANGSTLNNCILYYNSDRSGSNYAGGTLNYCCTAVQPPAGTGNFTNAPLFVDLAAGNLRLQSTSPCINAGLGAYAPGDTDLDGSPRISGGTVDVGAYEFQGLGLSGFTGWLWQYGLRTDGSADYLDTDHDRHNNWQEWMAGTNPTNAASVLQLLPPIINPPGLLLRWSSDTSHAYFVQRATSLSTPVSFTTLRGNIPGLDGVTAYTDTSAVPSKGAVFYRVGTGATNGSSSILLQPPVFVPASATLTWVSVTNRSYFVERATKLAVPPVFSVLQSNISGELGTTSFTDSNAPSAGPVYYRVGVQP